METLLAYGEKKKKSFFQSLINVCSLCSCLFTVMAECQVPTEVSLTLPSASGLGRENIIKGS